MHVGGLEPPRGDAARGFRLGHPDVDDVDRRDAIPRVRRDASPEQRGEVLAERTGDEGPDVLGQAAAAEAQAGVEELATDPVVQPEPSDNRFKDPEWKSNQFFDFVMQAYLLTTNWANPGLGSSGWIDR